MNGDSWERNWERERSGGSQLPATKSGAVSSVFSDSVQGLDKEDETVLVRRLERSTLLDSGGGSDEQGHQGMALRLGVVGERAGAKAESTAASRKGGFDTGSGGGGLRGHGAGASTVAGRVDVSRGGLFNFWEAEPAEELSAAAVEMRKQLQRNGSRGVAGVMEAPRLGAPTREEGDASRGAPGSALGSAGKRGVGSAVATRAGLEALEHDPRLVQSGFDSPPSVVRDVRDVVGVAREATSDELEFSAGGYTVLRPGSEDIDDEALRHMALTSGESSDGAVGKQMYRLFVAGLPTGITHEEIFRAFQCFGHVYLDQREVRIHRAPDDRLYSFILYDNVTSYRKALAADGQVSIRGSTVSIEPSHGLLRGRCFRCGQTGHQSRDCVMRDRCSHCGVVGHRRGECPKRDKVQHCSKCDQDGHSAEDCPSVEVCDLCHQPGHRRADCPMKVECFNCKQLGHRQHDCPLREICFACHQTGHKQVDCPVYGRGSSAAGAGAGAGAGSGVAGGGGGSRQRGDVRCYNCGTYGHKRSNCPYGRLPHRSQQKVGVSPSRPQPQSQPQPQQLQQVKIPVLPPAGGVMQATTSSGAVDGALGGLGDAMRSGGTGKRAAANVMGSQHRLASAGGARPRPGPDLGAPAAVGGPVLVPVRDEESWGGLTLGERARFSEGSEDSGGTGGGVQLPFVDLNTNWGDLTVGASARAAAAAAVAPMRQRVGMESASSRKDVRRGGARGGAATGYGGARGGGGGGGGGGGRMAQQEHPVNEFILRVRNLPFEVGDAGLRERFSRYGRLVRVSICRDNRGTSKGWGFVAFVNAQGMEAARKAEDESLFAGNKISVTPISG